jgi:hypothetical protein
MSLSISDKDVPNPTTLTTLTLYIRGLTDNNGKPYDLSGASKIYATIKDSLADADAAADVHIDSVSDATQFVTTYASTGNLDVTFTTTDTDLTAGTLYYIDVKAVWADGTVVELVRDTVVFDVPPTLAVS